MGIIKLVGAKTQRQVFLGTCKHCSSKNLRVGLGFSANFGYALVPQKWILREAK